MHPAAAAACCRNKSNSECERKLSFSLSFVLGAALLGTAAALLGRAMGQRGTPVLYVIAFIPMIMSFHRLGWIKFPFNQRLAVGVGAGAAFLSGIDCGIDISPCGTPILASVLSQVAYKRSITFGSVLLFLCGVGSSAPIALVGSAAGRALERWGSPCSAAIANSVTGALLVATSFYLLWRVEEVSDGMVMLDRQAIAGRGRRLEYFTVAWNMLEGLLAILAGALAGSISLVGFGIDSFIEVASAATLLWLMSVDQDEQNRERNGRLALRIVGFCFIALAVYIAADSIKMLLSHQAPEHSIFGIAIATASLVAMPLLSRAKRRVADALASAAMRADSRQTDFCTYLSAILLFGLAANWLLGWWWADPAAALIMAPIIGNEGREGLRSE